MNWKWFVRVCVGIGAAMAAGLSPAREVTEPADRKLLGSPDTDLVFVPLLPCRIVDTRIAGGMLAAGSARSFRAHAPFTPQGGGAYTCGLPTADPAALALTIVAVNPQGAGDLRAYPAGNPPPNASVLNYALPGQGLNIANTTIVRLTQSPLQDTEFVIQADAAATHVVIDVVGYFWSPDATPLSCVTQDAFATVAPGQAVLSATCPVGYTVTGGGQSYTGPSAGVWWNESRPAANGWRSTGFNATGSSIQLTVTAVCCRIPGH